MQSLFILQIVIFCARALVCVYCKMFVSVVKSAFKINLVIKYLFWYQISGKEKEYTATVVEVVNGDGLMVKTTDGTVKKVFLASIRPPREQR